MCFTISSFYGVLIRSINQSIICIIYFFLECTKSTYFSGTSDDSCVSCPTEEEVVDVVAKSQCNSQHTGMTSDFIVIHCSLRYSLD